MAPGRASRVPAEPAMPPARGPGLPGPWSALRGRLGSRSRVAGLAFAALTVVLLALALATSSVVFEVDSVVSFLAAGVLLLSDPRRRADVRVMDAIISSGSRAVADLTANSAGATYAPRGKRRGDVVLVLDGQGATSKQAGTTMTAPGAALAELFFREYGVPPSVEALEASLTTALQDYGLASSAKVLPSKPGLRLVLGDPGFDCECAGAPGPDDGLVGCPVASFLAIALCAATGGSVVLGRCAHDRDAGTWEVSMETRQLKGARK